MSVQSKRFFGALCLGTFLLLNIGVHAQSTLASAIKLTKSEQFDAAKDVYDKLIVAEPNNGDNYFYYGENYILSHFSDTIAVTLNDVSESAKALFRKGTQVDPENPLCYVGLAKVALLTGDTSATSNFKLALSKFPSKTNKASTLSPAKQALTYAKMAETMIQAEVQNVTKPLELMDKAGALDAQNPEIFLIWGDVFLQNNDGSSAITKYKTAQELDPQSPSAKLRLGKLWGRARNWNEAIKYYQEALKIDSTFAPAYVELGAIYMMAGKKEVAKQYFEKYLKLASTIRAKVKYLSVLIDLKDYATAIPFALEIKSADPGRNDMNRALAYCYYETKDYAKAREYINTFFKNTTPDKTIVSDWTYRGKIETKLKNDSVAIDFYKTALNLDTLNYDIYSDIANGYSNMKKFNDAALWYEKKISRKVATYSDYFQLGKVYYQLQDYVKSDTTFSYITENKPEFMQGKAFLYRGRAHTNIDITGELGLANPFYEKYISIAKTDSVKNARELIEAYDYFQFYYLKVKDYCKAKYYTEHILSTDPEGKIADVPKFKDLLIEYTKKCPN
jgi:tetratricopeptide (TPR) repeat protein